jgi:hypothetical protein
VCAILINCAIPTGAAATVTILAPPTRATARDGFHNRLKPAGPPSGPAASRSGVNAAAIGWDNAVRWLGGVVCSYRVRFGVGELLRGSHSSHIRGRAMLIIVVASFAVVVRIFQN